MREDRHRIAVLTNDHKSISDQIQAAIEELHGQARLNLTPSTAPQSTPPTGKFLKHQFFRTLIDSYYPFAFVDSVSEDSPASAAGIQVGDQLCQFGEVRGTRIRNPKILTQLAAALKANEGKQVETRFLREGQLQTMVLTPQKWGGPGLIG